MNASESSNMSAGSSVTLKRLDQPGKPQDELPNLTELPRELGVLLASVGVLGMVLPGIAGAPALLAGGLVLWPKTFGKVENWFQARFPGTHRTSMHQVGRFLDDLNGRYPHSTPSQSSDTTLNEPGAQNGAED